MKNKEAFNLLSSVIYNSGYNYHGKTFNTHKPDDESDDIVITDYGTPIAILRQGYSESLDEYKQYLEICVRNFKSQKDSEAHKNALIDTCINMFNVPVVFIPDIDIGFGTIKHYIDLNNKVSKNNLLKHLKKLSKYTSGTNNVCALYHVNNDTLKLEIIAYFVDMVINGTQLSCGEMAKSYKEITISDDDTYGIMFLYQPAKNDIMATLDTNISNLWYYFPSQDNDFQMIQLYNDIYSKTVYVNGELLTLKQINIKGE